MVVVDIDVLVQPEQARASLLWIGVAPSETDGNWLLPGAAPKVLEASAPMELAPRWSLVLPMNEGLRYFAVVDADGSGGPDRGEPIGGPIDLAGAARAAVTIDRRLGMADAGPTSVRATVPVRVDGARRTSDGSALAPAAVGEGVAREIVVECAADLSFFDQGRLVVAGFPPGEPWTRGVLPEQAAFLRTGERVALRWPIRTTMELPDGLDLVVGLDLDGDGDLGPGDLVAKPRPAFAPGGAERFVLDRTLPRVRPPPPPEHRDFKERPIEPGEPDGSEPE